MRCVGKELRRADRSPPKNQQIINEGRVRSRIVQVMSTVKAIAVRNSIAEIRATPAAVAMGTGFSDQPHLTRLLKRATGLTPAEAVAQIVAENDKANDADVVKVFQIVVRTIDELDPSLNETSVRTVSLLPGMRLARDLITDEGVVLLAKGTQAVLPPEPIPGRSAPPTP